MHDAQADRRIEDGVHRTLTIYGSSLVLQIDGNGTPSIALSSANGIAGPGGINNITFDPTGNFYAVNYDGEIVQFAPGSTTPNIFAPNSALNNDFGSIAAAPDGDIYYAVEGGPAQILQFTTAGDPAIFDVPTGSGAVHSLAFSTSGDLFALASNQPIYLGLGAVYRYSGTDPNSEVILAGNLPRGPIALSADQGVLYMAGSNLLRSLDLTTGEVSILASGVSTVPTGIAVYVPEPSVLALLLAGSFLVIRRLSLRATGRIAACVVAGCITFAVSEQARASFIPGAVYVAYPGGGGPVPSFEVIKQYDPATGQLTTFSVIQAPLSGGIGGLAFTPDAQYLRASIYSSSLVLQIDGNGTPSIALSSANGIAGPGGINNITFDPSGNFYVVNYDGEIVQFEPGSTAPNVFAPNSALNNDFGSIAASPNGDIYYAVQGGPAQILQFTTAGDPTIFDVPTGSGAVHSLTFSTSGDLFALASNQPIYLGLGAVYRYSGTDPSSEVILAGNLPAGPIALSADQNELYIAGNNLLRSLDLTTGDVSILASGVSTVASGMAVYVPEPSVLALLLGTVVLCCGRYRPARPRRLTARSAKRYEKRNPARSAAGQT